MCQRNLLQQRFLQHIMRLGFRYQLVAVGYVRRPIDLGMGTGCQLQVGGNQGLVYSAAASRTSATGIFGIGCGLAG